MVVQQLELSVTGKVEILVLDDSPVESDTDDRSCLDGKGQKVPCELGIGTNHCQCYACKRFFWSVGAFDKHQRMIDGRIQC